VTFSSLASLFEHLFRIACEILLGDKHCFVENVTTSIPLFLLDTFDKHGITENLSLRHTSQDSMESPLITGSSIGMKECLAIFQTDCQDIRKLSLDGKMSCPTTKDNGCLFTG
jgi:hypothetical protein